MTPWEREIWKEAARHAANHPWTTKPLAISAALAIAVAILWLAQDMNTGWFSTPTLPACIAGLNVLGIVRKTLNYIDGLCERPGYITPAAGQRTSIQELPSTGERHPCGACGRRSDRMQEIQFTSPGRTELRRFAMHESCENTAEGQAVIAAEKLLAGQKPNTFTPTETIEGVMEQARRDFRERESG